MEYNNIILISYIISAILFILGIKKLGKVHTARQGNFLSAIGMLIAISATFFKMEAMPLNWIVAGIGLGVIIGVISATKVAMTAMPEMVAIFNGFGGGASALVASAELLKYIQDTKLYTDKLLETNSSLSITMFTIVISVLIGTVTFTGSFIAWGKLQGKISGQPITYPGQNIINGLILIAVIIASYFFISNPNDINTFYIIIGIGLLLGILSVIPIGGADMPVVISLLNSYSGIAAAATGFVLQNQALIVSGCLVGASGIFLTNIMCKGMNRSLSNVLFSAFGKTDEKSSTSNNEKDITIKEMSAENAAYTMQSAESVIIVPGYGMAVAQAQHEVRKFADELEKDGVNVKFAVHPVAGRMPGHMNVLLAEANVPYDEVFELEEINNDFANCDVAYVIGANDVTNPVAKTDPQSPIYGMPILDVEKSKSVLFVKRSLSPGYAGIDNDLFYRDNTLMLFADAKKMTEEIIKSL